MRPKKALRGDPHRCENCAFFIQHYIAFRSNPLDFHKCYCGHCFMPRLKNTRPDCVCGLFKQKENRIE